MGVEIPSVVSLVFLGIMLRSYYWESDSLKILKFIIKSQNFIDPKFESGLGNKQTN